MREDGMTVQRQGTPNCRIFSFSSAGALQVRDRSNGLTGRLDFPGGWGGDTCSPDLISPSQQPVSTKSQ